MDARFFSTTHQGAPDNLIFVPSLRGPSAREFRLQLLADFRFVRNGPIEAQKPLTLSHEAAASIVQTHSHQLDLSRFSAGIDKIEDRDVRDRARYSLAVRLASDMRFPEALGAAHMIGREDPKVRALVDVGKCQVLFGAVAGGRRTISDAERIISLADDADHFQFPKRARERAINLLSIARAQRAMHDEKAVRLTVLDAMTVIRDWIKAEP